MARRIPQPANPRLKPHEKKFRQKWLQAMYQRGLCCWCEKPMNGDWSWEHIVPRSQDGSNGRLNRVLAHSECNRERGVKPLVPRFTPFPKHWRALPITAVAKNES